MSASAPMKLYGYFRSSATWRVRIALHFKGLPFDYAPVHLLRGGGEQHQAAYRAINPQGTVPVLEVDLDGQRERLAQSLAILEFLEETYPTPALLPRTPLLRARARQLAEICNSGIQPYQTVLVLKKVGDELGADRNAWAKGFIASGLTAFEAIAAGTHGRFAVGDAPSFADLCLVPQLFGARRFGVDLGPLPLCQAIEANCLALAAFQAARPEVQPDAEA